MNISYNWLKEYISTDKSADEIAKILTATGLEVGTVEKVQSIKGGLEGLVVGEVLTCEAHENSNHLHVTTVNIGTGDPLQIVCGAPNVAQGEKVIVATVGTKLNDGDDTFKIKKSSLRGVASFGMLCAEDEIGVGSDHDGIMLLPKDTPVGMPAKEYFDLKDDEIIEVDITPNRADGISHLGVARELAAYFYAHQIPYTYSIPEPEGFQVDNHDLPVTIEIVNQDKAPRYAGLTMKGITVKESPKWLQDHLNVIGVRPINNIVDISNYIMHAYGQPMHIVDMDEVKDHKIVVKTCAQDTPFTTLDKVERKLNAEDLMICDAEKPLCIAGVFGGLDSGVTNKTTSLFIESAYFNPVSIRKTAKRHALNTDASFRFERGIDPNITIYALKMAALMIKELAGGTISCDIIDLYPNPIEDFKVNVSFEKIENLIGKKIEHEMIERIFHGLEIKILHQDELGYELQVPAYRVDVQRDVDIIEDILRIYGYNNIELSTRLVSNLSYSQKPNSHQLQNKISNQLTANGFNEILNNSLTKAAYYTDSTIYPEQNCVKLMNPLSNDLSVMRQTLLFGGLENIARNANRQYPNLKFYEFGHTYHFQEDKRTEEDHLLGYKEESKLGLWITGLQTINTWTSAEKESSFYDLKAYVNNILIRLGLDCSKLKTSELDNEIFIQALEYRTAGDKHLVTMGLVHPQLLKKMTIASPVYFAEIDWKLLLKQSAKMKHNFQEPPKFPEVKRDLALLLDKETTFKEIEDIAYKTERKFLKNVVLFDVYEGKKLPEGKKSYAVNFTLQDPNKTLNDKQIETIMKKLIQNLTQKLNATLR